jgi:5-methyltetrahydrofolate--homocysteine methyltransferase
MKFDANRMSETLVAGNAALVVELTREALAAGAVAADILENGLLPGMEVVGKKFKAFEMFIPEVLRSAKAMHAAMEILRPLLAAGGIPLAGTLVIGTVQGDLHDIGKNLVAMMFEGAGFTVVDLGVDVTPQKFAEAVSAHQATLLGMSALLTTTMPRMAETIEAVRAAGLRERVKILVGGAPATPDFAKQIGADGYAPNATAAVEKAKELLG